MRLVLDDSNGEPADPRVDQALVKAVLRGRRWFEDLASGRVQSLIEIAEAEGVSDRYVGSLIPLAFLAPDIVTGQSARRSHCRGFDEAEHASSLVVATTAAPRLRLMIRDR